MGIMRGNRTVMEHGYSPLTCIHRQQGIANEEHWRLKDNLAVSMLCGEKYAHLSPFENMGLRQLWGGDIKSPD